ncbi:hypothetical protein GP486_007882 [Trichoglossum hirsutum]|uniref:Uncharacterized protein n=1 Tax=Trichoglossum hirsutum TaxID=265104 RepID=A0A9P8IBZ3_9PEZI|nr:hypothetical protein GP486_007882 [Trichoglossum hirsutum]
MASRISLDDFLRALARTPRRSARGPREREKLGLGNALGTMGGSIVPDHQPQLNENFTIQADTVRVQMVSPGKEGHQRVVSKRKPGAPSYSRKRRAVGNNAGHNVECDDTQAQQLPGRNTHREGQAVPSRTRKVAVARKRRVPVNELVIVKRIEDDVEPVSSGTAHDLIDDPICGSQELLASAEACPQPQESSPCSHWSKVSLGIPRNNAMPKRASPIYIDLSEFRMPAITANRTRRARRGGSGFDGVGNAKVLPDNTAKAKGYRKKRNTGRTAIMGKLTLVNSAAMHVPHAGLGQEPATDNPVPVESGVNVRRRQQIPAVPLARQPLLQGGTRAAKGLPITVADTGPVIRGSSLAEKAQRRVSFASDLCTQFPPSKPHEPPEKCATTSYSRQGTSGRMAFPFPVKKRRVTFDQEIYEQFARVTAPARKRESESDGDVGSSGEDSLEEWSDQDNVTGKSEPGGLGEDDEEEEKEDDERGKLLAAESSVEGAVTVEPSAPPTRRPPRSRTTSLRELTRRTSLGYGTLPASARQPLRGRQTPFLIPFKKATNA